jgi:hypothetical protein
VSDAEPHTDGTTEPTLAELIARAKPMGDLSRFVIDDLTEEDEDEFFSIIADA